MSADFAGRHVVGFGDLNIDIFLEVQDKRYSQILYLIDYVVPGLHFWLENHNSKEMDQNLRKSRFTNKYPVFIRLAGWSNARISELQSASSLCTFFELAVRPTDSPEILTNPRFPYDR